MAKTKSLLIFVKEKLASGLMCGTMEEKEKVEEFKSFKEASRSFFLLQVATKRDAIPLVEVSRRKSEQEKLKLSWVQYHWLSFQRERVKERRGSGAGSLRPI